jgi:hypothetical protein
MHKSFKEMPIWQEALDIAEKIFKLTEILPKKEDYGLRSQFFLNNEQKQEIDLKIRLYSWQVGWLNQSRNKKSS